MRRCRAASCIPCHAPRYRLRDEQPGGRVVDGRSSAEQVARVPTNRRAHRAHGLRFTNRLGRVLAGPSERVRSDYCAHAGRAARPPLEAIRRTSRVPRGSSAGRRASRRPPGDRTRAVAPSCAAPHALWVSPQNLPRRLSPTTIRPGSADRLERLRPDHRLARGVGGVEVDRRHDRPVMVAFGIVDDLSRGPGATVGVRR